MNIDFYLDDKSRFNARCSAIIYDKEKNKVLLFKMMDNDYYMLPGGRIAFNETSEIAVKREIFEETGFNLNLKLKCIQENFVEKSGIEIMQYAFCYEGIYEGKIVDNFKCLDNNSQMFYWVNLSKIDKYNIVPKSSVELIKTLNEDIQHIVEKG